MELWTYAFWPQYTDYLAFGSQKCLRLGLFVFREITVALVCRRSDPHRVLVLLFNVGETFKWRTKILEPNRQSLCISAQGSGYVFLISLLIVTNEVRFLNPETHTPPSWSLYKFYSIIIC